MSTRLPRVALLAALVLLAGCGGTPKPAKSVGAPDCQVKQNTGRMGVCVPKIKPPPGLLSLPRQQGRVYRGEDVSSYQPCRNRSYLAFLIFKLDEGNSWHDPAAACNHRANAGIPNGPYFFARPGSAIAQADRFANDALAIGATRSLPATLDYETQAGGCDYIRTFASRYMARTHNRRFIVYSAAFIWPGCSHVPAGVVLWDAAYGSSWSNLTGFAGGATIWQYSDGVIGPTPHLDGNDSDVFLRGSPAQLVAANVGPPPKPKPRPLTPAQKRRLKHLIGARQRLRGRIVVSDRQARREVAHLHALKTEGDHVNRLIKTLRR